MEYITAEKARKLSNNNISQEMDMLMEKIKTQIETSNGIDKIHIYEPLHYRTIDKLENLGYRVEKAPSISIQKDSLYYSIYW